MHSRLRSRYIGCILFIGICTIVLIALRQNVGFRRAERFDSSIEGILLSDEDVEYTGVNSAVPKQESDFSQTRDSPCYQVSPLTCIFDNRVTPGCYLINNVEAVAPLALITKQYETFGSVHRASGTLYVRQSNADVPSVKPSKHEATGHFLFFDQYEVEARSRVKIVIADEGIPLSSQWDSRGYAYPIQIAQFGLSHYTKLMALHRQHTASPTSHDGYSLLDWDVKRSVGYSSLIRLEGQYTWKREQDGSFRFYVSDANLDAPGLTLHLMTNATWRYFVLSGQRWNEGTAVTVHLTYPTASANDSSTFSASQRERGEKSSAKSYFLVYTCKHAPSGYKDPYLSVSSSQSTATFWMPQCAKNAKTNITQSRVHLARDLFFDLLKAFGADELKFLNPPNASKEPKPMKLRVHVNSIQFSAGATGPQGGGLISELRLGIPNTELLKDQQHERNWMTEALFHKIRFLAASSWFLHNQHPDGAWTTPVARRFRNRAPLKPGWPSAMAQGHGISLLVRAYNYTGDEAYLRAARNALPVYNRTTAQNGFRSLFLNQSSLPWYEEYPTEPGLFVLNGFIYSLFGLYDLAQIEAQLNPSSKSDAVPLLESGLSSLSSLLPLFDSGMGSFYDLGHVMQLPHEQQAVTRTSRASGFGPPVTLASGPNRARWDYHVVHIRQLRILATLDDPMRAEQWLSTANRWTSYMLGFRSPHN